MAPPLDFRDKVSASRGDDGKRVVNEPQGIVEVISAEKDLGHLDVLCELQDLDPAARWEVATGQVVLTDRIIGEIVPDRLEVRFQGRPAEMLSFVKKPRQDFFVFCAGVWGLLSRPHGMADGASRG